MRVFLFKADDGELGRERSCLAGVFRDPFLRAVVCDALGRLVPGDGLGGPVRLLVPGAWGVAETRRSGDADVVICSGPEGVQDAVGLSGTKGRATEWVCVMGGARVARFESGLLGRALEACACDVLAVWAEPSLVGPYEALRLAGADAVAGYRRVHTCRAEPTVMSKVWPEAVFVRSERWKQVPAEAWAETAFSDWARRVEGVGLSVDALRIAAVPFDLGTEDGLLDLMCLACARGGSGVNGHRSASSAPNAAGVRAVGPVVYGRGVEMGQRVVLLGPVVIGDGVRIGDDVIVDRGIVGSGVSIESGQAVRGRIVLDGQTGPARTTRQRVGRVVEPVDNPGERPSRIYRWWPRWSYPVFFKRVLDIALSTAVLLLFAPVFPFIALAVKLSSPGPVFYRARRQGLHGKLFDCLKFRTMRTGAESLQDKLRAVNQVDGPQFKMEDDPRTTAVGQFLRETCIDEIPQFLNVLMGQMSVVGPRPSPEAENTQCRPWRDARLSVRPGITGLWQVCRTRQAGRDFQEWIRYDVQYVRQLSWKMDLWICARTFMMLVDRFIEQF